MALATWEAAFRAYHNPIVHNDIYAGGELARFTTWTHDERGRTLLSETFDVGKDLGSPVSLAYLERSPFAFSGAIDTVRVAYR